MNKIIGLIALALTIPAYAEWSKFDHNANGQRYIDTGTLKRAPPLVRFWTLIDVARPVGRGRSMRILNEINCREETLRILTVIGFTGEMATGNIIQEQGWNTPGAWQYIASGTASENLFAYACR